MENQFIVKMAQLKKESILENFKSCLCQTVHALETLVLIPVAVLGLNSPNCDCQWLLQTYLFIFSLPTCICFPPFTFLFPLPVLLISSFPFALYYLLPFTLFTQTDGLISPRGRRGNFFWIIFHGVIPQLNLDRTDYGILELTVYCFLLLLLSVTILLYLLSQTL